LERELMAWKIGSKRQFAWRDIEGESRKKKESNFCMRLRMR
jgi:hypothetical protein